jgi:hypothetical protein
MHLFVGRKLSCCPANSSLDCLRQSHRDEVIRWIQIVFAGLIDDPDLMKF